MFSSFVPFMSSVKTVAISTVKVAAYTAATGAAVYGGLVLAKKYGGVVVTLGVATGEQVVGG